MAGQDKKGSSNAPMVTKDKLDLNLSPLHPIFLHLLATTKRKRYLLSIRKKMMTVCQSLPIKISLV